VTAVRHRTLLLAGALAGCLWLLVSLGCSSGSRAQGTTTAAGMGCMAALEAERFLGHQEAATQVAAQ